RTSASYTTQCAIRAARCCTSFPKTISPGNRGKLQVGIAMSRQVKTYISPEDYLAFERQAENKNEYVNGEIFAMTGASRKHNLIAGNVVGELGRQLKGKPFEVYPGR